MKLNIILTNINNQNNIKYLKKILILIIFFGCYNSESCINKEKILIEDTTVTNFLEIQFFQNKDSLEKEIKTRLNFYDICNMRYNANVQVEINSQMINVPIFYFKYCPWDTPLRNPTPCLRINIDNNYIDKAIINTDSIIKSYYDFYKEYFYIINTSKVYPELILICSEKVKMENVLEIIKLIIDSYLLSIENYCTVFYNNNFCEISSSNLQEVKCAFPLKINFAFKDSTEYPPPPPLPPND